MTDEQRRALVDNITDVLAAEGWSYNRANIYGGRVWHPGIGVRAAVERVLRQAEAVAPGAEADALRTQRDLYKAQRDRYEQVRIAMLRRAAMNPICYFVWRRPWRAKSGPSFWAPLRAGHPRVAVGNLWMWLRNAHDCADPAVGCTCSGGFLFPPGY